MRAGRLRHYVTLYRMEGDPLSPVKAGNTWAAIEPSTTAHDGSRRGLRTATPVPIITRPIPDICPDFYIVTGSGGLYYVDEISDKDERHSQWFLSCTELVGSPGVYSEASGSSYPLRAKVIRSSELVGDFNQTGERTSMVELAQFELKNEWKPGDSVLTQGVTWDLHDLMPAGDDGVVVAYLANARG